MKSYTPQSVAMLIRKSIQDDEKKVLQKSVEAYVKRLNF